MKKILQIAVLILCVSSICRAQQNQVLSAAATTCTATGASCLIYGVDQTAGGATFTVTSNASGNTLNFEATGDGGKSWVALNVTPSNGTTAVTSTSSTGTWQGNVAAYTAVRIRMSTLVSGTSTVSIITSLASARSGGGGGVINGAGSNPLGASFNVKASGAIGDAKETITAVTGNGSASITDATRTPWLASDVGKKIFCVGQGGGGQGNSALTTTIATIATFVNSGSITVNTTGNGFAGASSICKWFTQKDTTAFLAAGTSAAAALTSIRAFLGPTLSFPSAVYCPPGNYVVDGPWFIQNSPNGNTMGISFIGAGKNSCNIWVSPDVAVSTSSWMMNSTQNSGFTISGFTVDCALENLAVAAAGMNLNTDSHVNISNVELDGCGTTGDSSGLVRINAGADFFIDGLTFNNAPTIIASNEPPLLIGGGSASITLRNLYTTNPGVQPITISTSGSTAGANAGGPRSVTQNTILIENSILDEGGNPGCLTLTQSSVNLNGVTCMEGTTTGISVDANSSLYMTDSLIAPFNGGCSAGTRQALTIATTGYVYATASDFEGCGTDGTGLSAAVKGTSAGTFVSAGGNTWRNCTGSVPCPLVTVAQFPTRAFNGGIIPKSSETHTPNTCHLTITPIANATTYTLCNSLLDQNYQIINIAASSQVTTTCATAPIVTIGDGTNSATLTLTSAAATWNTGALAAASAVVFASGNTMTVKYDVAAASACATPPTNLAVSYVLQSVLNP